jgi:hypothetical protein
MNGTHDQRTVDGLLSLDELCACGHELGFHTFRRNGQPSPCGFAGCVCADFQETTMLNPHDPFAGLPMGEPPEPDGPLTGESIAALDARMSSLADISTTVVPFHRPTPPEPPAAELNAPLSDEILGPALTPVFFPVLARWANSVPLDELAEPARRVAELVEAIQPVLAPPAAVAELEQLVARANALVVTGPETYKEACDLYEQLRANEKGIEEGSIGAVVAFFHRPWKVLCEFRARFAKQTAEAAKRLSEHASAWRLAEERRAQDEANEKARREAAEERDRLRDIAARAAAKAKELPADDTLKPVLESAAVQATEAAREVTPIPQPVQSRVPATATKGRKKLVVDEANIDEDAFYEALLKDRTRRIAAPIDVAYLNRQIVDMGEDISQRFPGIVTMEKGGLTAGGRK